MQRYLFALGTLVDVPLVPVLLAGLGCLAGARLRRASVLKEPADRRAAGNGRTDDDLPTS